MSYMCSKTIFIKNSEKSLLVSSFSYIILYYIILYYIVLYCIILYLIILDLMDSSLLIDQDQFLYIINKS